MSMTMSTTIPPEHPRLAGRPLQRGDIDALHAWLATEPEAEAIHAWQAEATSWSASQRGLGEAPADLSGLWRATRVVRSSTEIDVDDPDEDLEVIEAAHEPDADGQSVWSDEIERLYLFLEIRGGAFRELDASVYPLGFETTEFDSDLLTHESRRDSCQRDDVGGIDVYRDWSYMIERDEHGFAPIADLAGAKKGRAAEKPRSELFMNRWAEDGRLFDRLRRSGPDTIERTVFFLAEGYVAQRVTITYARFAVPGGVRGRSEPTVEIAVRKPRKAVRSAKRAPRPRI